MNGNALIFFARRLARGQVKTRLARSVGEDEALRIYQELVECAHAWASRGNWKAIWALTGMGEWPYAGKCWEQPIEGDLGDRMDQIASRAFAEGASRVILVGTDIPTLGALDVGRAFDCLAKGTDVVTIPTRDGGYGAVGFNRLVKAYFAGRTWSHNRVHLESVMRSMEFGLSHSVLPCRFDVDEWEDWLDWKRCIENEKVQ